MTHHRYINGNPPKISVGGDYTGSGGISSDIVLVNFSGWVMPSIGVSLRNSPNLNDKNGQAKPYHETLSFDAWTTGETVTDYMLGTPDNRWFRIAGTNEWVPSGYIYGNPPGSGYTNPGTSTPTNPVGTIDSEIIVTNFTGWVMPSVGVALRNSPHLQDRNGQAKSYHETISFDAWTTGDTVIDYMAGTPDNRWFRIAGTSFWVPSGYIYGNPGGVPTPTPSNPTPIPSNPTPTPTPSNPTPSSDPSTDSYNVNFQLNGQSIWGTGSLPNWKDERSINLIDTSFNVGVGNAYLKFGINSSIFASPGTIDANIQSNFNIVHPTIAHAGDVITLHLDSNLTQGSQSTYLGFGYNVGGYIDFGFNSSVPFISSFGQSFEPNFTDSLQDYIPNLGITTNGSYDSRFGTITSEGDNNNFKFDLYKLFPSWLKDTVWRVALDHNVALGAEVGPVFKQKSDLHINQFLFDINGTKVSTSTIGSNDLSFTIPSNLKPGETYTIMPKVKPETQLSNSFSISVEGSLYAEFPYIGKHDLSFRECLKSFLVG